MARALTTSHEKTDKSLLDKFVVHGVCYWISIGVVVLVGISRFVFMVYLWLFFTPIDTPMPKEVYLWLGVFVTFPVVLHIIAGYAEVDLNKRRKRRYGDKIM
jgi:hypothetical protein